MQDMQISGLENAVWWTEFLIRNRDVSFLKNAVHNFNFYEYYLLDVVLFCAVVFLIGSYINLKIVKFCFRCLFRKNKVKRE